MSGEAKDWCSHDLPCARYEALEAENERLREALRHQSGVLESRDKFIVDQGLWWTFCNQTARAELKEDTRAALETKHD